MQGAGGLRPGEGLLLVVCACLASAFDNNFTARISAKDPFLIAICKGLCGGSFYILAAYLAGQTAVPASRIFSGLAVGFVSFGLSLVFFIRGMREIGAARGTLVFGTNFFIAALLSVLFLGEPLTAGLAASAVFSGLAVFALSGEKRVSAGE